jgi:hypothetical protein
MSRLPLRGLSVHGRANNKALVIAGPMRKRLIIELKPVIGVGLN